jgi:hypothetical protein
MRGSADLQGRHRGERGFVLGTGMSIALMLDQCRVPMTTLGPEVVVGCKQVYRQCPLRYWVSMDFELYLRERHALSQLSFLKFVPQVPTRMDAVKNDRDLIALPRQRARSLPTAIPNGFSDLCIDADTGVVALRIAYLLGLNPIYLLGMNDGIYQGRLHYHDESKRVPSEQELVAMASDMVPFISAIVELGVSVISCSPISRLNAVIPFVDICTLFDANERAR